MNRGTLPIVARLQSLQTPSRLVAGGARIIAEPQDRSPIASLLRAANETVLGRSLRFDSSSGASATLDVAGRRVLRLTAAQGLPGAETCLGLHALDDEHKDDLIKLLQALAAPRQELRVTAGPIGRGGEELSVGLPVALLADLLLVELNPDGPEDAAPAEVEPAAPAPIAGGDDPSGDRLDRFARGLGPALIAWLITGGDRDGGSDGPEEMVSHLQGFLEDEADALHRQLDTVVTGSGGPICIMLGATLVEGHSVVCARADQALLLGVIEGDGTQTALTAWNAALR